MTPRLDLALLPSRPLIAVLDLGYAYYYAMMCPRHTDDAAPEPLASTMARWERGIVTSVASLAIIHADRGGRAEPVSTIEDAR